MRSFLRKSALVIIALALIGNAFAKIPLWSPAAPSAPGPTTALSIPVRYGIDTVGTVYIVVININDPITYVADTIKSWALSGQNIPLGRVATAVVSVPVGNINTLLTSLMDVINPNTQHTVYVVAEGLPTQLTATTRLLSVTNTKTKTCPNITPATNFTGDTTCVNIGALRKYGIYSNTGILKGADWKIVWGDGSLDYSFTSLADGQIPASFPSHTYPSHDSCFYSVTLTI